MTACGGADPEKEAQTWLNRAQTMADKGDFDNAMAAIDSLRKKCPEAKEARKVALKLYQQVNLKAAQKTVEEADKALQTVNAEYEKMRATVNELKAKGVATGEQFTNLTLMRMKRDSLRTVFDVECAKIKYIKTKMKEL